MSEITFQDTPLYAWLRANAWFLLAGVAVVGGIVTYRNLSADWAAGAREESWDAYRALAMAGPDSPALSTRLGEAKSDPRIFPWVVMEATRQAAQEGDVEALALLKPELQGLAQDDSIRVATPGGREGMAAFLLRQLEDRGAGALPKDFVSPEPTGRKVEIVVSLGAETTYAIVAGLYEEQCPVGTAAFLSWVEAGRMNDQSARLLGTTGLTMNLTKIEVAEGAEAPPTILVERPYGLFHEEGTIGMLQLPGQFGAQDPGAVQLLLMDLFQLDGQATVLAKVLEGLAPLKAALEAAGPSATVKVVSARAL